MLMKTSEIQRCLIKEIPEFPELSFDESSHTYRLNDVIIPSVTTLMNPLSAEMYKNISSVTLSNAADKGTAVHNAIENYIKFDIVDIPPEHSGYFDGFLEWWNQHDIQVVASEVRVYHKIMRYGGTIDLLAYVDGVLTLIDIKTTSVLSEKSCGVQLEAYSQALKSLGFQIEQKIILHLKKDGKCTPREFPLNDAPRWRVFGSLKCVYDYIQSA